MKNLATVLDALGDTAEAQALRDEAAAPSPFDPAPTDPPSTSTGAQP